jgi:hypothetical protein
MQGLEHGTATNFRQERQDPRGLRAHERSRHELGEVASEELLVRVAQSPWIVEHERRVFDQVELLRQMEIAEVEGRVLANEDGVERGQMHRFRGTQPRVGRRVADGDRSDSGGDVPAAAGHLRRQAVQALVSPRAGSANQGEGRVLVEQHLFGRIHHEEKAHPVRLLPSRFLPGLWRAASDFVCSTAPVSGIGGSEWRMVSVAEGGDG